MGYTRTFTKQISVHYSGSVHYPASQSGGFASYSGTTHETVHVSVHVDTDPVDESVADCNHTVDLLTGSVAATEAAEIVSIRKRAHQIGSTIISGFFRTIRSDISQQISELANSVESHVLHLQQMAKRCLEKQVQMQNDYTRITSRYEKIFSELNKELENRIYELDKPTFDFKRRCDAHNDRAAATDMVATSTVGIKEAGTLQGQITVSVAKRRALDAIDRARDFLTTHKHTRDTIDSCMVNNPNEGTLFLPVFFVDTVTSPNVHDSRIYTQKSFSKNSEANKTLQQSIGQQKWAPQSQQEKEHIRQFFISKVMQEYPQDNKHAERVRENIIKLFNI